MKTPEVKIKIGQIWKFTGTTSKFFTHLVHYEITALSKFSVTLDDDDADPHGWDIERFRSKFEYVKN